MYIKIILLNFTYYCITISGITIALILVVSQNAEATNICETPRCVQEASNIIDYLDSKANACTNFHQFSCGSFLEKWNGDANFELKNKIKKASVREIISEYRQVIQESDHETVKVAKKLYQECLDGYKIIEDLETVKTVLKNLGGWPILDGYGWIEDNFDWLNATYELRRLGYHHAGLLDVVGRGLDSYEIMGSLPSSAMLSDYYENDLLEVAEIFRAPSREIVRNDSSDVYLFALSLYQLFATSNSYNKESIKTLQQREQSINWLEILNNMTDPGIVFTEDDYIWYRGGEYITNVFKLISTTPKRTVANYMMWYVVEPLIRFLPKCPLHECDRSLERPLICLRELHETLTAGGPNPMDILRLRRYLPEEKRKSVETLVGHIKTKFLETISKSELLHLYNKQMFIDIFKKAHVIVGMRGNYFDNTILDESHCALDINENDSFFTRLAKIDKNFQTTNENKLGPEIPYSLLYEKILPELINHGVDYVLYIPLSSTRNYLYDENRPQSLNYGALGTLVASSLLTYIEHAMQLQYILPNRTDCLLTYFKQDEELHVRYKMVTGTIKANIAQQISYAAYEEWVKNNSNEKTLVATKYTPKQLFWISAASIMCQPTGINLYPGRYDSPSSQYVNMFSLPASVRQNPNFAEDFNCPPNSEMNPTNRCNIMIL